MAFPADFERRVDLTIASLQIGSGTHNGLVVYINSSNIPSEALDADGSFPCQANGADVRFSSDIDGNNELPRHILLSSAGGGTNKVHLDNDPANGEFAAFVRLPTVESGSDFTFYMWYSSTVTESEPINGDPGFQDDVWQDYFAVYLFQETLADGAQLTDYSGNGRHGTWSVGTQPTQVARNAANQMLEKFKYDYTSTGDFSQGGIYCPVNWVTNDLGTNSFTITFVGYMDGSDISSGGLLGCDGGSRLEAQAALWANGTDWEWGGAGFGTTVNRLQLTKVVQREVMHFTRGVGFGAYEDSAVVTGGDRRVLTVGGWDNTDVLALFKGNRQGTSGNALNNDVEAELYAIAQFEFSEGRITTEFNNLSDPASFITAGTPGTPTSVVSVLQTVTSSSGVVENARVLLEAASGGSLPYQEAVTITRAGTTATVTHTGHGLSTGDEVAIRGDNTTEVEYTGVHTITVVDSNTYTYTVSGSPSTPASGSINATKVILNGLTDANGQIEDASFPFSGADQPISGTIRKSTSTPFFKPTPVSGSINSSGYNQTSFLILDE